MFRLFKTIFTGCLLLVLCTQHANAQDYNFSQFWENKTYYNPAFVGFNQGEWNNNLTYRRLWPDLDGNFSTILFSSDIKTYNNYGLGFRFISSDVGGLIKANSIVLAYSWRGYINKERNIYFQLGIEGGFNHEKMNDQFVFSGQLDPIYGLIYPNYGVNIIQSKQNYWDFSTGAFIALPIALPSGRSISNYIGLTVNHFTRSKDNFLEDDRRIPIKLGFQWYNTIPTRLYSLDRKSRLTVRPGVIFESQGEKIMSKSSFENAIIGLDVSTDPIMGGLWYSSQVLNKSEMNYKALIFKLGMKFDSNNKRFQYRVTYSYDMSLGNLVKSTEGSHEIGISIMYRFDARYNYNIFSF